MYRNIALIGFMASGKTTIGKELSRRIGFKFIDTDSVIESVFNMTISQIFEKYGEIRFREVEIEVFRKVSLEKQAVISCGGGAVLNWICMQYIKSSSIVIYLHVSLDELIMRLMGDNSRPLIKSSNNRESYIRMNALLRELLYVYYADLTIDVSNLTVDQAVNEIINCVGGLVEY
ncbi:MAG: shikimate kinase [Candidatus Methanomethylicia archaeon]